MITAHEAMTLVRESEAHIKKQVEDLDFLIRKAAMVGKRSIDVSTEHVGIGAMSMTHPYWRPLKKALEDLGFRVQSIDRMSGGGLGSMGDDPVPFEVVVVSW